MIYFDNASASYPKSISVIREVRRVITEMPGVNGRGNYSKAKETNELILETRIKLKEFFGSETPFEFAFVPNTTIGINMLIKGVLHEGDRAITTTGEHNSVLRPLKAINKNGVLVSVVEMNENGEIEIDEFKDNIKENTKAIIINFGNNILGSVINYKEIIKVAKENNIFVIADMSQAAGHINIDFKEIQVDFAAISSQKGMLGINGASVIYVRDSRKIKTILEGGTGTNSISIDQPSIMPEKFEVGTLNIPAIASLKKGIEIINKTGLNNIIKKEKNLTDYFIKKLLNRKNIRIYGDNEKRILPIVSFNIEDANPSHFGEYMNQKGFAIRTGYTCASIIHETLETNDKGVIRVSFNFRNTYKEIDEFIISMDNYLEKKRSV